MAVNVATLTGKLVMDTKGLKSGLGSAKRDVQGFQKQTQGATKKGSAGFGAMKKAAIGFGVAIAGTQAVKFAKDSIDAFSNLEESINAVNVVYGDAAEGVHALGEDSADAFGLSTRALNDAAVGLGAFVDKIDASDPANAFENIIGRAGDFGSVMNITTEDTLEKFRAGLSGEAEPLKQFGLNLSQAEVEAVALREGIIGVGEKMSEGQKIQARYKAIMEQTAKTAGDFAATSDGLAGSQKKLGAKWEEAQAVLGKKLAPAFGKLLEVAVKLLPIMGPIGDVIGKVADQVVTAFNVVEDLVEVAGALGITFSVAEGEGRNLGDELRDLGEGSVTLAGFIQLIDDKLWKVPWEETVSRSGFAADALDAWGDRADGVKSKADLAAGATSELNDKMGLMPATIERTAPIIKKYTDKDLAGMTQAAKDAKREHDNLRGALDGTRTAVRRLIDPIFNAERAYDDMVAANEAFLNDGGTQQQYEDLVEATSDLAFAEAQVGFKNVEALGGELATVNTKLDLGPEKAAAFRAGFDSLGPELLAGADAFADRLTEIGEKTIQVNMRASLPSDAEIDDAVERAIARAIRNGGVRII